MIHLTQILTFEISRECNYKHVHKTCPIDLIPRADRVITDELIIKAACDAYLELGFEGLINWSIYSEPMLQYERMLDLMVKIRSLIPQSRFLLWTNASIVVKDDRMKLFEYTHVSNYEHRTFEELFARGYYNVLTRIQGNELDDRLNHYGEPNNNPCTSMFSDFMIANDGEVFICCHDWLNQVKIGNLFDTSLKDLDAKRWEYAKQICGKRMTNKAHPTCLRCRFKWPLIKMDHRIKDIALQEIAKLD